MKRIGESNDTCTAGGGILPYLFGELPPASRDSFELHLASCHVCIDELADLSDARYAVYEWRMVEFMPLSTPEITIPVGPEVSKSTWIDAIRTAFAWPNGWAVAGGLAAMLVVTATTLVVFRELPTEERSIGQIGTDIAAPPVTQDSVFTVETPETTAGPRVVLKSETTAIRTTKASAPKKGDTARIRQTRRVPFDEVPPQRRVRGRFQESATLGEYVDYRDDSLRLTDIFEDIGTKELD